MGGLGGDCPAKLWLEPKSEVVLGDKETPLALDNSWQELDAASFRVRGAEYLTDKVKVPSRTPLFSPVGVQCYQCGDGGGSQQQEARPFEHVAARAPTLAAHLASQPDSFFLLVGFMLPGPPFRTALFALQRTAPVGEDPAVERLLEQFVGGSDEFRAARFKYLPRIDVAPPFLLRAIRLAGGEVPTLLCNKLTPQYHRGANYIEIDIDISSSRVANMTTNLILPKLADVIVSHAFLLEGRAADELPERVLGTMQTRGIRLVENTVRVDPAEASAGAQRARAASQACKGRSLSH